MADQTQTPDSAATDTTVQQTTKHVAVDISSQQKTGAAQLSYEEAAQLAAEAGFSGHDLAIAVAVCTAESGRNPDALNSNGTVAPKEGSATDVYSVGLMQINLKAHPEYAAVNLFDPQENMSAAFAIYSAAGNRFQPWGGFTSGNYSMYLSQATAAVNA